MDELTQQQTGQEKDPYKFSRFMYILEAAFEHFIALMFTGAYLATLTKSIGLSDAVTGILSSFATLGCGFQIFAIFLSGKRRIKRTVSILHTLNQLLFALCYVVPVIPLTKTVKTVLFVLFLLLAYAINHVVNSPKINWFMSLVDNKKRGSFTANKEIVSLISGSVFSYATGCAIDFFEANGNVNGALIFSAVTVFVLTALHTATLLLSKEKVVETKEKTPFKPLLKELVRDKNLFKVVLVLGLWSVSSCIAPPFYGSYQEGELGFSLGFCAIVAAIGSFVRAAVSQPFGKYADQYSFRKMLNICFIIEAVSFLVAMFVTPANGKVLYTVHHVLHAVGLAGISSGGINLIYEYVSTEKRMAAFALKNTFVGFVGFFTTLAVSPLVSYIQSNGNRFLGLNIYAQQVLSAISFVVVLLLLVYLNTVVKKIKRPDEDQSSSACD